MSGKPLAAVWLTAALVLATVAEARADAAGQAQPVLTRDPSQYVRLGAGLGAYFGPKSSTHYTGAPWGSFVTSTTTVAGLSIPFELALGGPLSRGLVLGAGAYGEGVPLLARRRPRVVLERRLERWHEPEIDHPARACPDVRSGRLASGYMLLRAVPAA